MTDFHPHVVSSTVLFAEGCKSKESSLISSKNHLAKNFVDIVSECLAVNQISCI